MSPSRVMPVTATSSQPIMKSMWIELALMRGTSSAPTRDRIGVPEGEVARGVLVEQRVEEDRAGLADPTLAIDERELAEARRALVLGASRAHRVGSLVGVDLHGASALEADAAARERPCRARSSGFVADDDPVGTQRVGRGEDLLGRQVRVVVDPVDRRRARLLVREVRRREQADRQVGARAFEVERVEPRVVELLRGLVIWSIRVRHAASASCSSSRRT